MDKFLVSLAVGLIGGWIGSTLALLFRHEANRGTGEAGLVILGIATVLILVAIS